MFRPVIMCFFVALTIGCEADTKSSEILWVHHKGYSVLIDCQRRGAVYVYYKVSKDTGSLERQNYFTLDPKVPANCQQTSTSTYKHSTEKYDLGHLAPANHFDDDKIKIKESNYITNIVPMRAKLNRYGAWRQTEKLTECFREHSHLDVFIGVIYGNNASDDYFVSTHGIVTPDAFWKIIVKENHDFNAWLIPNSDSANSRKLDNYLVTIDDIEKISGITIPLKDLNRSEKKTRSWQLPKNCDFS